MEDPRVVAGRLTETAKEIADEARVIANKAIADSADADNVTTATMVDTFTKAVDLAVRGGIQLTRDLLDRPAGPADPGEQDRRLVADVMETITRRMIRQTGAVFQQAADEFEKTPNSPNIYTRSMVKLANISLLGSIELAETALIGPAAWERELTVSEPFVAAGDVDRELRLTPAGLHRPGTSDPIPAALVSFRFPKHNGRKRLPNNVLPKNKKKFRIGVDPRHLISGIYVGTVEVVVKNVVTDTVAVEIAI